MADMDAKDRIIAEQRLLIAELRREIEELKLALAKATKDSSNSSKSPSSDIIKPPKKGGGKKSARGSSGSSGGLRGFLGGLDYNRILESRMDLTCDVADAV